MEWVETLHVALLVYRWPPYQISCICSNKKFCSNLLKDRVFPAISKIWTRIYCKLLWNKKLLMEWAETQHVASLVFRWPPYQISCICSNKKFCNNLLKDWVLSSICNSWNKGSRELEWFFTRWDKQISTVSSSQSCYPNFSWGKNSFCNWEQQSFVQQRRVYARIGSWGS